MNTCTICGSTTQNIINLYDQGYNRVEPCDLISMYLHIQSTPGSLKTDYLCGSCLMTLMQCHRMSISARKYNVVRSLNIQCRFSSSLNPRAPHFMPSQFSDESTIAFSPPNNESSSKYEADEEYSFEEECCFQKDSSELVPCRRFQSGLLDLTFSSSSDLRDSGAWSHARCFTNPNLRKWRDAYEDYDDDDATITPDYNDKPWEYEEDLDEHVDGNESTLSDEEAERPSKFDTTEEIQEDDLKENAESYIAPQDSIYFIHIGG